MVKPLTAAVGVALGLAGQTTGWPVARGGSGSIAGAMVRRLEKLGEELDGGSKAKRQTRADTRPIAGTRLIREYQGVEHCVTVRDDDFEYQGRPYQSLSAIARAITGTPWSGPVFFGLKGGTRG